ncbi:protein translocase subunit SecF [Antrihabitans sp. YC3-6]|uniref:Protein-export membrane protein SecF n=1 Tax=Antrihabitans stalagmiti TaxID=2799499 RepID=A0A934NLF3_9NOCA|nr:protein translocase subunit SecF [Antrihabitans stalagmiti]MBJ8337371.1 protein translocase subunit SecF [Antrihabitans stalagmiti]
MSESTITEPKTTAAPHHSFFSRLYTGTGAFEVVGKRRIYYIITAVIILISLASILFRGFTLGIDFEGGSKVQFPAGDGISTTQVEDVYSTAIGSEPVSVQTVGSGGSKTFQIRSEALDLDQVNTLQKALFDAFQPRDGNGVPNINEISTSDVSETWGGQITRKALIALAVFLVLVTAYIALRYERGMAAAALAALFFDMVVTAGFYSLVGFEVTPATVIGLLTILGFSLYDSVVVFDKVEENTRGVLHLNKRTYAEQANLAINQTLMRSINTTLIGVLPVVGLMVIAVWLLGVGTLKDLALVQLVGMIVGAYSSIFFATPLLVSIKERWGPVAAHTKKVLARREAAVHGTPKAATAGTSVAGSGSTVTITKATPSASGPTDRTTARSPRPGARPTGKRHKKRH